MFDDAQQALEIYVLDKIREHSEGLDPNSTPEPLMQHTKKFVADLDMRTDLANAVIRETNFRVERMIREIIQGEWLHTRQV